MAWVQEYVEETITFKQDEIARLKKEIPELQDALLTERIQKIPEYFKQTNGYEVWYGKVLGKYNDDQFKLVNIKFSSSKDSCSCTCYEDTEFIKHNLERTPITKAEFEYYEGFLQCLPKPAKMPPK